MYNFCIFIISFKCILSRFIIHHVSPAIFICSLFNVRAWGTTIFAVTRTGGGCRGAGWITIA